MKPPVLTRDVMRWPEFRALAERLGIPLDARTTRLVLRLVVGDVVEIEHEFHGVDESKEER